MSQSDGRGEVFAASPEAVEDLLKKLGVRQKKRTYREVRALVKVVKPRSVRMDVEHNLKSVGRRRYSYRYSRIQVHIPEDWARKWVLVIAIPIDDVYRLVTKGSA